MFEESGTVWSVEDIESAIVKWCEMIQSEDKAGLFLILYRCHPQHVHSSNLRLCARTPVDTSLCAAGTG